MTGSYIPMFGKCNNLDIVYAAQTKVWDGTADTSWYTGDKDSYDISTPEQLAGLAKLCDEGAHEDRFRGVTINLTADIVLNDVSNFKNWETKPPKNSWEPIGNEGGFISGYCPFAGVFKGNGHTITGMYVKKTDYGFFAVQDKVGLFECICGAAITDVKFNKAYIASTGAAGVLAGISESSYVSGIEVKNSKIISLLFQLHSIFLLILFTTPTTTTTTTFIRIIIIIILILQLTITYIHLLIPIIIKHLLH